MKMQNKIAMIVLLLYAIDAHAMLSTIARVKKHQSRKQKQSSSVVSSNTYLEFRQHIINIGMYSCWKTFSAKRNWCSNKLCCRDAYLLYDNLGNTPFGQYPEVIERVRNIKNYFLEQIDQSETGRVQAALQIKQTYKKLTAIERQIHRSDLQKRDIEALQNLMYHQKKCLHNQFRVIVEASPIIEERSRYTLGFSKNGNLKVERLSIIAVPVRHEGDKE